MREGTDRSRRGREGRCEVVRRAAWAREAWLVRRGWTARALRCCRLGAKVGGEDVAGTAALVVVGEDGCREDGDWGCDV